VPATGPDKIEFIAYEAAHGDGRARVDLYAPAGTLTSSDVLPTSLDGFGNGTFYYDPPIGVTFPYFQWGMGGTVGSAIVPEPASVVLSLISMALIALLVRFHRRKKLCAC
jgi:hypothetical protein